MSLNTFPRQRVLLIVIIIAILATVIIWFQMRAPEQTMQSAGYGIVSYELAFSAQKAGAILDAWNVQAQSAARRSLLIDFAFMPAYALFFSGVTLLLARQAAARIQQVGQTLVFAPLVAAMLDALENLMLLQMLNGGPSSAVALIAGVSASIKFTLLIVTLLYWVAVGVHWIVLRMSRGG